MKKNTPKNGNILFLTGLFFINLITCILLLSSVTFFLKGTVAAWQFPAAIVLSLAINFMVCRQPQYGNGYFFRSFLAVAIILIISLLVAGYFYDVSYDGQAYHQEGIYQLKNGWNPYYTMLPDSVNQVLYINHYSKGVELPQSAIYATLNHIETGKATNIMLLVAAFCLVLSFLYQLNRLSAFKCILLSVIITLNPIAVNQLLTYYVDGQLATLLLCFLAASLFLVYRPGRYHLLLLASVIIILVNIKFTAVVYAVLFIAALLGWLLFSKRFVLAKQVVITAFIAGVIGVVMVGYNPYIVNTVKYQHPFYPLMGKHKIDIISYNLPPDFDKKSNPEKLFISLFSHTGNITLTNGKSVSLKIPFTFNKNDIANAPKPDTRIGGFGPLFSGILLLACLVQVIVSIGAGDKKLLKNSWYLLGVIIVAVLIIPESWWARYIPELWFFPAVVLFVVELSANKKVLRFLKPVLYFVILLNICFSLIGIGWNFLMTNLINYQLTELEAAHKKVIVQWGSASSNRVRFTEHHIAYKGANLDDIKTEEVVRSDSRFIVPDSTINLPKSTLVKWAQKFQKQQNDQ